MSETNDKARFEKQCKALRAKWPAGPWVTEPDRVEWRHKGVPCLIVRSPGGGHLCGYAAVPPGHPWHGKGMGWDDGVHPDVHGGVTYAEGCAGQVCHVPQPGEPDNVWWLGFDCAHLYDLSPGYLEHRTWIDPEASYKGVLYVKRQAESLAEQILAAG